MEIDRTQKTSHELKTLKEIACSSDRDAIVGFAKNLEKAVNTKEIQLEIYHSAWIWMQSLYDLALHLLTNFKDLYLKYESLILRQLLHPCTIISNIFLLLLLQLAAILPLSRVTQLNTIFLQECTMKPNPPAQFLRYLACNPESLNTIIKLVTSGSLPLAFKIAAYISPNTQLHDFIKQRVSLDSPCEIHYILLKASGGANITPSFKSMASRVWASFNSLGKERLVVTTLLEYSAAACIKYELNDLDVLKSVIVALTCAFEYINSNADREFELLAKPLINKISFLKVEEKHSKKFRETIEKILIKLEGAGGKEKTLEELESLGEDFCRSKLDLVPPIMEIQKMLGINSRLGLDCDYSNLLVALDEITAHIKEIKSFGIIKD